MKLPQEVRDVRDLFIQKFPYPDNGAPGSAFENEFRQWFGKLVEQLVYSFPTANYGWKKSGTNHPPSKDTLAQWIDDKSFYVFDMFLGVATGKPTKSNNPTGSVVTGQVFIPVVGVNHLGNNVPPPPPPEDDLKPIYERLKLVETRLYGVESNLDNTVKLLSYLSEKVRILEERLLPGDIAKRGDVVAVTGSINIRSVLTSSEVTWRGKIL